MLHLRDSRPSVSLQPHGGPSGLVSSTERGRAPDAGSEAVVGSRSRRSEGIVNGRLWPLAHSAEYSSSK
jgi:hypothetical protein